MKSRKFIHPTDRLLIFIIVLLIGALISVLWYFGDRLNNLELTQQVSGNTVTPGLGFYIQDAASNLYSLPAVTDASSQRVYIPEAKIYLPMSQLSRSLYYSAVPAYGSSPEEYNYNTSRNIHQPVYRFSDVPCLQRMAGFTINKQSAPSAGTQFDAKVGLADGRTLYLYQNENSASCRHYWAGNGASAVIDILKQAKSY